MMKILRRPRRGKNRGQQGGDELVVGEERVRCGGKAANAVLRAKRVNEASEFNASTSPARTTANVRQSVGMPTTKSTAVPVVTGTSLVEVVLANTWF
jgi:hypothetical protein